MLRRKLIFNLGPLVVLLLATTVAAIMLLQGVLKELDHVNSEAWVIVDDVNQLSVAVNAAEVDLYELQLGKQKYLDPLIESVQEVQNLVDRVGSHSLVESQKIKPSHDRLRELLPEFTQHIAALATVQDEQLARKHTEEALSAAVALRQETLPLSRIAREHAQREQDDLTRHFRWVVISLGLVFLVVINVSVLVLVRMATIILRPVDQLVMATRELSQEHFTHRVELQEHDEFDELASAYNRLAEHLQQTDKQRMEVLAQVALALNHELNNAMGTIQLQLDLLNRKAGSNPLVERRLRTIQDGMARMKDTVQSLKQARRIVLTDYAPGQKMLDLARSVHEGRDEEHEVHSA